MDITLHAMNRFVKRLLLGLIALVGFAGLATASDADATKRHTWEELPPIPDQLGLFGAFAGVHGDALIVAGGTNFAKPLWENEKVWHDRIFVLTRDDGDNGGERGYQWHDGGKLPRASAYGGSSAMFSVWSWTTINGYLYTTI